MERDTAATYISLYQGPVTRSCLSFSSSHRVGELLEDGPPVRIPKQRWVCDEPQSHIMAFTRLSVGKGIIFLVLELHRPGVSRVNLSPSQASCR